MRTTLMCIGFYAIGFVCGFVVGQELQAIYKGKKNKKSKYPKCDCNDVNQCTKYCNAKYLFKKDFDRGLV
jgi:hypothetical protein